MTEDNNNCKKYENIICDLKTVLEIGKGVLEQERLDFECKTEQTATKKEKKTSTAQEKIPVNQKRLAREVKRNSFINEKRFVRNVLKNLETKDAIEGNDVYLKVIRNFMLQPHFANKANTYIIKEIIEKNNVNNVPADKIKEIQTDLCNYLTSEIENEEKKKGNSPIDTSHETEKKQFQQLLQNCDSKNSQNLQKSQNAGNLFDKKIKEHYQKGGRPLDTHGKLTTFVKKTLKQDPHLTRQVIALMNAK